MTPASKKWRVPAFEEINMSAEIGAYQGEEGGGNTTPKPRALPRDLGTSES
jgi:hypothetical protein